MKKNAIMASTLSILAVIFCWNIWIAIRAPADISKSSESGRYTIENVPLKGLLSMPRGMAHLRIIDRKNNNKIFRTPLYSTQSLDMRDFEDSKTVGIYWIIFYKENEYFSIGMPQWRSHWLNWFISNTPYEIVPNG